MTETFKIYRHISATIVTLLLLLTVHCSESFSITTREHQPPNISLISTHQPFIGPQPLNSKPSAIDEILNLLRDGDNEIELSEAHRNVTLVLGITGSGKSTYVQWIAGDDSKLIAKDDGYSEFSVVDTNDRIGEGIISKTVIPELVIDNRTDLAYYDCPGFSDTRNSTMDIAGTYFIKKVADYARAVRLLFVVSFNSVRGGSGDRIDILTLFRHATGLVRDVDKFRSSIALAVTKVETKQTVTDERVIEGIWSFLNVTKHALAQDEKTRPSVIQFVDAILQRDPQNAKIAIFRKPDQPGPLSESETLQRGKQHNIEMINSLAFTPKDRDDFGYSVSDQSKNDITLLVGAINQNVRNEVEVVVGKIRLFYQNVTTQVKNRVKSFASDAAQIGQANQDEAQQFAATLARVYQAISGLVKDNGAKHVTTRELATRLNATVTTLALADCLSNVTSIANQTTYLEFLQVVSGGGGGGDSQLAPQSWIELELRNLESNFETTKSTTEDEINKAVARINGTVNDAVSWLAGELRRIYQGKIESMDIQLLPAKLAQDHQVLRNMTLTIQNKLAANNDDLKPRDLVQSLGDTFKVLNIEESSAIKRKTLAITTQDGNLQYLQTLVTPNHNTKLAISSSAWTVPFNSTLDLLEASVKWYLFLIDLYAKLSEYEIQSDTTKYDVANLEDWGVANKTGGLVITRRNWPLFMAKVKPYNLRNWAIVAQTTDHQPTELQLEELNQALRITLKSPAPKPQCKGHTVIIKGDYVKLSDLTNPNGTLKHLCGEGATTEVNEVKVFALNTVFIDANLNATGSELKLTIIAPTWVIVDGKRLMTLSGTNGVGPKPAKAKDGVHPGNDGSEGEPGAPGGTAGSFFGVVVGHRLINAQYLTVATSGGSGGTGQRGGNGKKGLDGRDAEPPYGACKMVGNYKLVSSYTQTDEHLGISSFVHNHYRINGIDGSAGGSGGDGGHGGIGGNQGNITLFYLNSDDNDGNDSNNNNPIVTINVPGINGTDGQGGDGSQGGRHGISYYVYCRQEFAFTILPTPWQLISYEKERENERANSGKAGETGRNTKKAKAPNVPVVIRPVAQINEYKGYLYETIATSVNGRFQRVAIGHFLRQLDQNDKMAKSYDTMGLLADMAGLEQQFRQLTTEPLRRAFAPLYASLLARIGAYANATIATESEQAKKTLVTLYTAVYGRLNYLRSGPQSSLIVDVESYLDLVKEDIQQLNSLRQKQSQLTVINKYRADYQESIDRQIKEAEHFIENIVKPELDTVDKEMQAQVKQLIKETAELAEKANKTKNEASEKMKQMTNLVIAQGVMSGLKQIGTVASLFGPQGQLIGAALQLTAGIGESVTQPMIDNLTGKPVTVKLPPSMEKSFNEIKNFAKGYYEQQAKEIEARIDTLKRFLADEPVLARAGVKDQLFELEKEFQRIKREGSPEELAKAKKQYHAKMEKIVKDAKVVATREKAEATLKKIQLASNVIKTGVEVGVEVANTVLDSIRKIEAANDAFASAESDLIKLHEFEKTIYDTISPTLQKATSDMKDIGDKLGSQSSVALDVTQWKVQGALKDLMNQMAEMTEGTKVGKSGNLARCIERMDEAMILLIKLYDRVQDFQHQANLANFIADINSASAARIDVTDPTLSTELNKLELSIRSNIVLQEYDTSIGALKQLVFPYARLYLPTSNNGGGGGSELSLVKSVDNIDGLVSGAIGQIEVVRKKLKSHQSSIWSIDKSCHVDDFNSGCTSPFYVWPNAEHRSTIAKLLAGEVVVVKADVTRSPPNKDAIKFDVIGINLKAKNQSIQSEINTKLNWFNVRATHLGRSSYRYGGKFYAIQGDAQQMSFSIRKNADTKEPMNMNNVYRKLKSGNLMLSPYTTWEIQLTRVDNSEASTFEDLSAYAEQVDLELIGHGRYIDAFSAAAAANDDHLKVDQYYQADESVVADPGAAARFVAMYPQLYSAQCVEYNRQQQQLMISNANNDSTNLIESTPTKSKNNNLFQSNTK